jgi:RND family efflux transporter MFP subunit
MRMIPRQIAPTLLARALAAAAMLVAAALAAGCGKAPSSPSSPPKAAGETQEKAAPATQATAPRGEWVSVRRGTIRSAVPAVGVLRARQTTKLGPQVSGRVEKVIVDVGDVAKKGQELVRLDPVFFEIERSQRAADLEAAKAALWEAETQYTRMKNLWEKPEGKEPSIPKKLFDDAKARFDGARARLTQAQEALRYAEERLRETVIRAPYDAVVTQRLVDAGEPVTSTPVTHLLEVQEVGTLDLEFSLPQELLSRVRIGTPVTFEAEGVEGAKGEGEVAVVFPAVDEASRSFRLRVVVPNPSGLYRPGMLLRVRAVDREVKDALVLPRKAVTETASGWQALAANSETPVARAIRLGVVTEAEVEVKEGLREGEKVLVPGGKR